MRLSDPTPGNLGGRRVAAACTALAAMLTLILAAAFAWPAAALAATPTPTANAVGDPRSSGQGPGLVGDPLAAIVVVAAIAILTLVATLMYVRLTTGGPDRRTPGGPA